MAIVSAAIEENGWVLAVRGDWGASDFTAFALDPDGAPKIELTVRAAGFDRVDRQAVANPARIRRMVATKPLRKPYPDHAQLDEADHGDGTRTVRLALSNRIHAGEVVSVAAFAPEWRRGEGAAVPAVANNSMLVPPLPIVRIAVPHMQLVDGPGQRLELIIASHFPEHHGDELHQAVAAVKFVATDNTRTNEVWVTSMSTSTVYGDNLRCWGVDPVESGLFAGLNPGNITTHWTVYPWIGSARSSGSGQVTTGVVAAVHVLDAEVPFVSAYDPGRTIYARRYVYVDAATGTSVPASITVGGSLAAAKAGMAAVNISVALQALYLQGVGIPSRNGVAAGNNSLAWTNIVLAPGVQTIGNFAVSAFGGSHIGRVVISGDPDDGDPRANVILRTMASAPVNNRNALYWLENMTVELGQAPLLTGGGASTVHFHNCEIRGKPGFEGVNTSLYTGTSTAGAYWISATQSRMWRYGTGMMGVNSRAGLLRNFESGQPVSAMVHVTSRKILNSEAATDTGNAFDIWTDAADCMVWQCEAYRNNGYLITKPRSGGGGTPENPTLALRLAIVDTIVERSGTLTGTPFFSTGETSNNVFRDCLLDGVSTVGNRINIHNDGTAGSNLNHPGTIFRNSWMEWNPTKHDIFALDGSKTGAWEILYGVGSEGNVYNNRVEGGASNFAHEYYGLRARVNTNWSSWNSNAYPKYVNDLSVAGPAGGNPTVATPGGGDYRPDAASPALGIGGASCVDTWRDGITPKGIAQPSGALPPAHMGAVSGVAANSTLHMISADVIVLEAIAAPAAVLVPAAGRLVIDGEARVEVVSPGDGSGAPDTCGAGNLGVRVLRVRPD